MNTTKKTRGILIDPHTKTVTELFVEGDTLQAMHHHVDCQYVEAVRLGEVRGVKQDLWIDEEGALCNWDTQAFFMIGNYPTALAGRGIVFATDGEGATISTWLDVEKVAALVQWVSAPDVVIPAPTFTSFNADGSKAETVQLAGVENWTYQNQP